MPKVSVLTPIYNTNIGHLCESINSILNQTFTDFEFILLNDSPDNEQLERIIKSYNDPRIRYVKNDRNIGISASRNKLVELARREYLAIFDHDDISMPDRLQRQVEFLDANPDVGVVSGWLEWFGDKNWLHKTPEYDVDIKIELTVTSSLLHTAAMIRKSVLIDNNIRYEEEFTPAEDYRLWARLWDLTHFHNIQDVMVRYRWNGNNTSVTSYDRMQRAAKAACLAVSEAHPAYRAEYDKQHAAPVIQTNNPFVHRNWRWRLFGIIPFLKRKGRWILFFDFIPFFKVRD